MFEWEERINVPLSNPSSLGSERKYLANCFGNNIGENRVVGMGLVTGKNFSKKIYFLKNPFFPKTRFSKFPTGWPKWVGLAKFLMVFHHSQAKPSH